MTFEDPTQLFKCTRVDCNGDRAGGTPFCARHLREQETSSAGYCEPELEARLARTVRTEDDDHPGEKKIYHDDGTSEWVPDPDYQPPRPAGRLYVGPDPDTILPEVPTSPPAPPTRDPTKHHAKTFRKALQGRLGPLAQALAERTINTLADIAE